MSNKEYAIIFDCDGTVLDTYQLIIETVYQTFAKMLPNYPLTYEEADAFFGPLLDDTFGKYAKDKKQLTEFLTDNPRINRMLPSNKQQFNGKIHKSISRYFRFIERFKNA